MISRSWLVPLNDGHHHSTNDNSNAAEPAKPTADGFAKQSLNHLDIDERLVPLPIQKRGNEQPHAEESQEGEQRMDHERTPKPRAPATGYSRINPVSCALGWVCSRRPVAIRSGTSDGVTHFGVGLQVFQVVVIHHAEPAIAERLRDGQ